MNKKLLDQIIQAILSFLGKNAPAELAKPVKEIVMQEVPQTTIVVQKPEKAPIQTTIVVQPLTKEELLMGRDKEYASEYTTEISANLDKLLPILNKIQEKYGKKFKVNSGWRPAAINASTPGAAAHSKHMEGLAADIADADGEIMNWTLQNLEFMKELGVHMEDWRSTPTWTHYQIVPPKSGHRIFIPSTAPFLAPNRWVGHYAAKYDA